MRYASLSERDKGSICFNGPSRSSTQAVSEVLVKKIQYVGKRGRCAHMEVEVVARAWYQVANQRFGALVQRLRRLFVNALAPAITDNLKCSSVGYQ